ncbi:DUF1178 family protein [Sinisalibacter lacisalsi]|uniref:DUF1178 domain-containing protein n=1 Tax=Sinisalibacter lacisalsi TaxID=1526570 RepID=A0ABQ1QTL4_9RHOB|nr:DUF1178 family protein [Sinisalibacter lacisalsi]GGD43148.1 hypothetical protein GCM10011358_28740 [Sinisalibacter lacisalsi]
MIRYTLKCPEGHRFESWFHNAAAYEALAAAGQLRCPDCGADRIEKSLMTPDVRPARARPPAPTEQLAPQTEREKAIAALKRKVEAEADYVGPRFAREARAMHDGTAPERPIYGEAKPEEAIALIEDGVPVAPLPFTPTRKIN